MKTLRTYSPLTMEAARLLGARIRAARRERRWTVDELAERVGVAHPTIRKIERGDPTVGLGPAFEAAALLGIPLFGDDPGRRLGRCRLEGGAGPDAGPPVPPGRRDPLAALRPRRSRVEAAIALGRAFQMAGRPYDYEFDFRTDSALVCSELVVKAWEPADGMKGLVFPLLSIVGRLATPPNEMIRVFDAEARREDRQLDFVAFLDGQEKAGRADESNEAALRASWKRPKWHVLTQDSSAGNAGR